MTSLAVNDAGDVLAYDGQQWRPAPVAQNDKGERVVFDGEQWRPLGAIVGAAKGRADSKQGDQGFAQAVGQGATFGFGDELTAAVRAAAPRLSNFMMRQNPNAFGQTPDVQGRYEANPQGQTVSNAPSFDQRYEEELARERAKAQQYRQDNPTSALAGNILGAGATTGLATMLGAPTALPGAQTLGGNMVRMGLTGAGYGGVQGFGEGEGGFENRLLNGALPGATFGGAFGAAMPLVGAGARAAIESKPGQRVSQNVVAPVAQRLAAAFEGVQPKSLSAAAPDGTPGVTGPMTQFAETVADPARAGAMDRLAVALQRSGLSEEQARRRLAELGPQAVLADIDPQFLAQARMANTMPGDTRSLAKNVLEGRDRGTGPRLVGAFEGNEPPPSSYDLNKAFTANTRAVGANAYQGDMANAGLRQSPELLRLYDNPEVKGAIDRVLAAEKSARVGRPDAVPASPIEIMHMVKQEIQGLGYDKMTGRPLSTQQKWRDLADAFVTALKGANPALAEADAAYAQAKSLPEFFNSGRSFLTRGSGEKATEASAPALADLLAGANPQQVTAAKAGATNAARETALEGTRLARALALRIDESSPVRDKLVELYGTKQADAIMKQAAAERTFAETSNEILRGSKTADKLADVFDNAGVRVTPGGVQPKIWERIVDLAGKITAPNESVRNKIGQITLTTNPDENARILARAFELLKQRRAGNPLSASFAGTAGASLASP